MNARRNTEQFMRTRPRSVSPLASPMSIQSHHNQSQNSNFNMHKSFSRLKDGNGKGPSPTSVMNPTFDFDDEPFDCSVASLSSNSFRRRPSSTGNLRRTNNDMSNGDTYGYQHGHGGKQWQASSRSVALLPPNPSPTKISSKKKASHFSDLPPPSPRKISSTVREAAAAAAEADAEDGASSDNASVSKKTSSFRQRRLRLAQQRRWREEMMEKTVQSKTNPSNEENQETKYTISGVELLMHSADGMEISISSHLEKEGFARSVMLDVKRREYRQRDGNCNFNYPSQSARSGENNNDGSRLGSQVEYDDPDLDAMTIDTVSSLNTMHTDYTMGTSTPYSPVNSPRRGHFRKRLSHHHQGRTLTTAQRDSLHPPQFVQSKVRNLKEPDVDMDMNGDEDTNLDNSLLESNDENILSPSDLEVPAPAPKLQSYNATDKTTNINHEEDEEGENIEENQGMGQTYKEEPPKSNPSENTSRTTRNGENDDENDIPAIASSIGKYDRSTPVSELFPPEAISVSELSGTELRRRRLKQYISNTKRANGGNTVNKDGKEPKLAIPRVVRGKSLNKLRKCSEGSLQQRRKESDLKSTTALSGETVEDKVGVKKYEADSDCTVPGSKKVEEEEFRQSDEGERDFDAFGKKGKESVRNSVPKLAVDSAIKVNDGTKETKAEADPECTIPGPKKLGAIESKETNQSEEEFGSVKRVDNEEATLNTLPVDKIVRNEEEAEPDCKIFGRKKSGTVQMGHTNQPEQFDSSSRVDDNEAVLGVLSAGSGKIMNNMNDSREDADPVCTISRPKKVQTDLETPAYDAERPSVSLNRKNVTETVSSSPPRTKETLHKIGDSLEETDADCETLRPKQVKALSIQIEENDENEEQIDSDLRKFADKRDRDMDEDDRSVHTFRSAQTLQTFATLKTCLSVKPATKEEMDAAVKKKQSRVKLLHHALTCTHPCPSVIDQENYVPCPEVRHCHALGVLVRHVQTCTNAVDGNVCEVPGCAPYKKIWNHYRRCVLRTFTKPERKTCKICGDLWRKYGADRPEHGIDTCERIPSPSNTDITKEIEI